METFPGYIEDKEKAQPTLEELDSNHGREIEGIAVWPERFKQLEEGADFKVVERNPNIEVSGVTPEFTFISPSAGNEILNIEAPHWRAIDRPLEGEATWRNPDTGITQPFYDLDIKGAGYLKPSAKDCDFEAYDKWFIKDKTGEHQGKYKVLGLSSKEDYYGYGDSIIKKSNNLLSAGLRSEAYWGIAKLERIPFRGEMVSVGELKKRGVIPSGRDFEPHQASRFFKMHNRIEEFTKDPRRAPGLFRRAFEVYNKEQGEGGALLNPEQRKDQAKFFNTFAERLGANLAVLMNLGQSHYRLHASNVTLAAEICDIGTLSSWSDEDELGHVPMYDGVNRDTLKDMRDLSTDLLLLRNAALRYGLEAGKGMAWHEAFMRGFKSLADKETIEAQGNRFDGATQWIQKIGEHTLVHNNVLPSLLHGEVEDWDIKI